MYYPLIFLYEKQLKKNENPTNQFPQIVLLTTSNTYNYRYQKYPTCSRPHLSGDRYKLLMTNFKIIFRISFWFLEIGESDQFEENRIFEEGSTLIFHNLHSV